MRVETTSWEHEEFSVAHFPKCCKRLFFDQLLKPEHLPGRQCQLLNRYILRMGVEIALSGTVGLTLVAEGGSTLVAISKKSD